MNNTIVIDPATTAGFDAERPKTIAEAHGLTLTHVVNGDGSPTSIWQIPFETPVSSDDIVAVEIDTDEGRTWTVYADAEKDGIFTAAQARSHAERLVKASLLADELNAEAK